MKQTQAGSKCAHDGCACTVAAGQQYCSDHCRQAASASGGGSHAHGAGCQCGHPACKHG